MGSKLQEPGIKLLTFLLGDDLPLLWTVKDPFFVKLANTSVGTLYNNAIILNSSLQLILYPNLKHLIHVYKLQSNEYPCFKND